MVIALRTLLGLVRTRSTLRALARAVRQSQYLARSVTRTWVLVLISAT
jgi:hypothetical protein